MSVQANSLASYYYVSPCQIWRSYDRPLAANEAEPSRARKVFSPKYNLALRVAAVGLRFISLNTYVFLHNRKVQIQRMFTKPPPPLPQHDILLDPMNTTMGQFLISSIPSKGLSAGMTLAGFSHLFSNLIIPLGKWGYNTTTSLASRLVYGPPPVFYGPPPPPPIPPTLEEMCVRPGEGFFPWLQSWDTTSMTLGLVGSLFAFNVAADIWAQRGENKSIMQKTKTALWRQLSAPTVLTGGIATAGALAAMYYMPYLNQGIVLASRISQLAPVMLNRALGIAALAAGMHYTSNPNHRMLLSMYGAQFVMSGRGIFACPNFQIAESILFKSAVTPLVGGLLFSTARHSAALAAAIGSVYAAFTSLTAFNTIFYNHRFYENGLANRIFATAISPLSTTLANLGALKVLGGEVFAHYVGRFQILPQILTGNNRPAAA